MSRRIKCADELIIAPARLTPPQLGEVAERMRAFGAAHPEIVRLEIFGSVARGEAAPDSDVDVLATFRPGSLPRGPFGADYFNRLDALERELAAALGRRVHLLDGVVVEGERAFPRAVARDAKRVYELEPTAD